MFSSLLLRQTAACWCITAASATLVFGQTSLMPQGGETSVIGSRLGDQTRPQVAFDGSAGSGFLVWQDNAVTPLGLRIQAVPLDGSFAALGQPVVVSSAWKSKAVGDQQNPHVTLLKNGQGAVVAWQGGKVGMQQVYIRFLGGDGSPIQSDIRVSTKSKINQANPKVATLTDGSVVVVWSSFGQDGSMWGIFAQRFTATGAKLGTEFQINQTSASNQRSPVIAALSNGKFVVAWISELQRGPASVDVFKRVFDVSGLNVTGDEEVPVNTSTNKICANPSIAASDAGFAIAWSEKDEPKHGEGSDPNDPTGLWGVPNAGFSGSVRSVSSWDVYGCFYDVNGSPVAGPSVLNTYTYGDQFAPDLSASGSNYLAVWTSLAQDGDQAEGVFGQLLSSEGQPQGSELHINSTTANRQVLPVVASNGGGVFLTLWSGFVRHNGFDLFSQLYQLSTP